MGRVIKIDWYEVNQISKKFFEEAENLKKIIDDSTNTYNGISEAWTGMDANNFITNSNECINLISKEYLHLLEWSKYLTKAALRYSDNVEESLKRMKSIEAMMQDVPGMEVENYAQ